MIFCGTAHLRAREQRYRERFVAIAEMKLLQTDLRECYAKNTVNAPRLCRPLAQEYMRRLKCPLYVCDMEVRSFFAPFLSFACLAIEWHSFESLAPPKPLLTLHLYV